MAWWHGACDMTRYSTHLNDGEKQYDNHVGEGMDSPRHEKTYP